MRFVFQPIFGAVLCTAIGLPAAAHEVGDVQAVTRSAYGTPPQAAKAAKREGDPVADHELLETLNQSGLLVRMADGSKLTLGADSRVLVDSFVYDPALRGGDGAHAAISLPLGLLRYVTGAMPKGRTTIDTPTATLTLRGTNVTVAVNPAGETRLTVDDGKVSVRSKLTGEEITVDPGSSIDITQQNIRHADGSKTGDPAVDRGVGRRGTPLGNDVRRNDHSAGSSGSRGGATGGSGSGGSGSGESSGGDSGGDTGGGGDSGGGDSGSTGG